MKEEKPHVLYVEDHDDTRDMVKVMLELRGIDMIGVDSGRDCLTQLKKHSFDLVLLDTALPDLSGVSLCRVIRKLHEKMPIMFYSAHAFPEEIESAMECGANDYLVKPRDTDYLPDRILRLIKKTSGR
jgi:DNA-binding response OmpR family regulator